MSHLQDIVDDIRREKCVLIIGADLIDLGHKSFFETMCQDIVSDSSPQNYQCKLS